MVPARAAAPAAVALVAGLVLAGCSALPSWTGDADRAAPSTASSQTSASPSPTPTPTPSGSPSASPSATRSATATPTPTRSPTPTPTRTSSVLRYGDTGAEVLALQRRLTALGYWLGSEDGSFGHLTQQAVFALQKAAGLSRDGVVGPDTTKALARGIRPTATITTGAEVDLGRQLLLIVRDGAVRYTLNTSTGNGEPYTTTYGAPAIARTPTGAFTFSRRVDGMVENSLGQLWRPIFFTSTGVAVHGSPSIPPYPASHGCVRVSNAAIDMVWARDLMPIGSTIRVR